MACGVGVGVRVRIGVSVVVELNVSEGCAGDGPTLGNPVTHQNTKLMEIPKTITQNATRKAFCFLFLASAQSRQST